jgi:large subunit ribosomal protein L9
VERVYDKTTSDIACILTDSVEGVGMRGDTVTVKRRLFRNRLLPAGLAVYASPENQEKFVQDKDDSKAREEEEKLGVFGVMTAKQLTGLYLPVFMSGDNHWVLTPKHIRIALRKVGVETTEDAILLPQEPITGEGEFKFRITVNKARSVDVKACVVLTYKDPAKNVPVDLPKTWTSVKANLKTKQPSHDSQENL